MSTMSCKQDDSLENQHSVLKRQKMKKEDMYSKIKKKDPFIVKQHLCLYLLKRLFSAIYAPLIPMSFYSSKSITIVSLF